MLRSLLKSKIHRATVTGADLEYEGSLTVDADLLAAAEMVEHEEVHVVNINTGARFTTYTIAGPPGTGVMQLNGAAARLGLPGDKIIVMSYASFTADEAAGHTPTVVLVGENNRPQFPPLKAEQ